MSDGNRAKTATAPLFAVLAADTGFAQWLPELFPHKPLVRDWFQDDAYRETHAKFNATLQIGYFLIGVRAAGLAAGPMAGFNSAACSWSTSAGQSKTRGIIAYPACPTKGW